MHFQLRKGIAAIEDNRTVKVKMYIYLALHFLRHQTHAFNTASLLKIFSTRLPQPSLFLAPCFWNIYLSWKLINLCSKWSCLHIPVEVGILSHLSWMVSSKITAAECNTQLHHPFPPKENLGMHWSSWLPMSTLRRVFCLQWPLWLTLPGMTKFWNGSE